MTAKYDTIGLNYANLRQPDPRIAARIDAALGDAKTVINVGAGAGNYEPPCRTITAVEPSTEMIKQRPPGTATLVQGVAEDLPFEDDSFDAAMAVLTVHHWTDQPKGLQELRRVSRGPVAILTYDAAFRGFWLADYIPRLITLDEEQMPPLSLYTDVFGEVEVQIVPIPHDCTDGFLAGYWRRPSAYLDERARAAMSSFWAVGDVSEALAQLQSDLEDGTWDTKYGHLRELEEADFGYRLVIAH